MADDMRIFLGIGSNIENRYKNLMKGIQLLNDHSHIWVIDQSNVYQSPSMYCSDQQDFYNMVIEIETNLEPLQLLNQIKIIEVIAGRDHRKKKNMPRTLDLDILAVGDLIIRSHLLQIPHPKIAERKFVLKPWNDIAPDFSVSIIDKRISELLDITEDISVTRRVLIVDKENSI